MQPAYGGSQLTAKWCARISSGGWTQMALFPDAFDALASLQQALDSFRTSSWLTSGPSGGGSYPPLNVFRKGDDFIIIAEVPGIKKPDFAVQVKGNTIR